GGGDVQAALDTLAAAPSQGFTPGEFGEARLAELGRSKAPQDVAARNRELHAALIAYARAEHGLDLPASSLPKDWALRPEPYDAEASLRQAVAAHQFKAWLAA